MAIVQLKGLSWYILPQKLIKDVQCQLCFRTEKKRKWQLLVRLSPRQHLTYLYTIMMKILGLFKLAGGVVFVCWQKLALVHVVDLFSGQVEREAKIFEHAVISAVEIIDRLDGNDRCHVQGTVAMLHKAAFNGIAARVIGNLPLDREETG